MMVAFPRPEPWPAELFNEYGIADLEALIEGAQAAILERRSAATAPTTCPDCGDAAHPSATICAGCGSHLNPRYSTAGPRAHLGDGSEAQQKEVILPMIDDSERPASAKNALASYEPTPEEAHVMWAHDTLEAALARPANVTPLRFWSEPALHSVRVQEKGQPS